jgi:DNA-binding XRE family transcriptional regulator
MISAEQIKAARAWIDWTRDALAHESGVSAATIRNLEKGKISHRSAEGVRLAFENKGFKFHGKNGLTRHIDESRTYEGPGSCDAFYDDLIATATQQGGEISAIFKTQQQFTRSLGLTDDANIKRLEQLGKLATVKCLLSDARHPFQPMPPVLFRAITRNPIGVFGTFIFADKTAVVVINGKDFVFQVMKSIQIAKESGKEFAANWETGLPLAAPATPNNEKLS